MQNKSFFMALGLTALTSLVSLSINLSPSLSQSTSSKSQPNKVTFFCREKFDSASGEKIRFFGSFYGKPSSKSLKALSCKDFNYNNEHNSLQPLPRKGFDRINRQPL